MRSPCMEPEQSSARITWLLARQPHLIHVKEGGHSAAPNQAPHRADQIGAERDNDAGRKPHILLASMVCIAAIAQPRGPEPGACVKPAPGRL